MTDADKATAQTLVDSLIQPGDLILTQTPSPLFGMARDFNETKYDHLVAVIDKERCLHISYPRAKLVPTILFVQQKKRPLILRCRGMTSEQRDLFIEKLKHNIVGKPYDYTRVLHYILYSKMNKMPNKYYETDEKVVCSHHLYKTLSQSFPKLGKAVQTNPMLDLNKFGTFTINDFLKTSVFQQIDIFPNAPKEIKTGSMGDKIAEQFSKMFPDSKVAQLLALQQKFSVIQSAYKIHKYIQFALVTYKLTKFLIGVYRDYDQIYVNGQQKKQNLSRLGRLIQY